MNKSDCRAAGFDLEVILSMKTETYRHLIDHIKAPVLILNDQGEIQHLNQEVLDLLGCEKKEHLLGRELLELISPDQQPGFQKSYQSLIDDNINLDGEFHLLWQGGGVISSMLSGARLQDETGYSSQTIWTLSEILTQTTDFGDIDHQMHPKDLQWLSDQGRTLPSYINRSDILDFAGKALQQKLSDCIVVTLRIIDESSLTVEGIYGLEKKILSKIWKLIGGNIRGRIFPIDKQLKTATSRRFLIPHQGGIEDLAASQIPKNISRKIVKMLGIEDIYTIGLDGNHRVMGCLFILTRHPENIPNADLVESFSYQVALALEKSEYADNLEFSEQQFEIVFEYAPDGYYISDLQGQILNGNRAAEKITGFAREELIEKNFLKVGLISKPQVPKASILLAQNVLGKSTGPDEFVLTRKDGSVVPVEISSYPVKIGEKTVVLGIARDISQRKQHKKNLEIAHGSLTRVLEGIDAHVYVADLDTHEILYMNRKMIEDFGGNFTTRSCFEVFRDEDKECSHCTNKTLVNERGEPGEVVIWEDQNLKNGRWYRNYDRAIYWTDQRLVRMQIAVDITDSKLASVELERSEERYRSLFDTSLNAIMTVSPPSWNFTSGNPAMVDMFKTKDEQEFLTYKPWELSPEFQPDGRSSKEKAQEMIQAAIDKGSHLFPWTHKKVTGEEFPATVQLTRVDLDDEFFIQATVRDITNQVQTEKQLTQKMDDLALLNNLNVAANQGKGLKEISSLLAQDTKRIFHCNNTTVYLLSEDKSHLQVDLHSLDSTLREQIIKLIGTDIPLSLEMSLTEDSVYKQILNSGEAQILTDTKTIISLMEDFLDATFLPKIMKKGIRKLIPQIHKLTNVQSVTIVPLKTASNIIGLIDISCSYILPEKDKERFVAIAEQLSGTIQRVRAEKAREVNLRELELINTTFVEGSRIEDIDDVCELLVEKVQEVNPDCYVMASLFDPEVDAIRVRALRGLGTKADKLIKLLGVKPQDIKIDVSGNSIDDNLNALYTSGNLERVPGGLFDLTRGTIPRHICLAAERMMGIGEVYIAGFGLDQKSTGGLVLFVKQGKEVRYLAAIETIVSHFSVIFERRLVQQEILQRKAQLEALRDVELDIVSQLNLKELLHSIAEKAGSIVDAKASGFSIYNPEKEALEFLAYTGFDELPENTDIRLGEGLSGKVWEKGETIIVGLYAEWEGRSKNWEPVGNYYLAGVPVFWGDELLGVLEIALDPTDELSQSDIVMLELFATQAAIAIQNARLFSGEKQRRQEVETLREVGLLINRMMDRPELLDMILTALQKVVPYNTASIQLVDGEDLVVEAFQGTEHPEQVIGTKYNLKTNKISHPVLYEGKKVIHNKGKDDQEWLEGPEIDSIQSWLAVPLEVKGNRIGLLSLDHYQPYRYTEHEANLALDFANQAAIALENNRLFEEIRRRTREIEAVYESALTLTQELHPDVLFEHLYEQIETLFKPDAFILATYEPTPDLIRVSYATEAGIRQKHVEGLQIFPNEKNSLLSWIIRKRTPLLIGNVETDSLPVQPQQKGKTIRSWLGVPLLVGNRLIGALVVQSYEAQAYTHDHRRLLQLLGNQVGIALENSRLFEDAQRRLSRLTSLREIDQAISGSLDLELTMEVLIDQLISTLEVDAACVLAYKANTQTLDYVSAQGFRTKSLQFTSLKLGEGLAGIAAVERSLLHIPDLNAQETSLQKAPLFREEEFITYLAHPLIAKGELVGILEVFHRKRMDPNPEWINFLDALARMAAIAIDRLNLYHDLTRSNIELKQAYDATIEGWARAIELRDRDTEGHSRRVVALMMNLARKMGITGDRLIHMRRGALLHDIGKMAIPDGILLKSGTLTNEEWVVMKKHPVYAYDMLSTIDYLSQALDIPYSHHERWDGSGYPQGLSGEDIPLPARIFAVVDVWDALQSDRPYRDAWSEEKAIAYLKEKSGKEFDPQVVQAFFELIDKS